MSASEFVNRRKDLERRITEEENLRDLYNRKNSKLVDDINYLNRVNPPIIKDLKITNRDLGEENNRLSTDNANYKEILTNDDLLLKTYYSTEESLTKQDNDSIIKKTIKLAEEYSYLINQNNYLLNRYNYIKNQFVRHDNKHNFYSKSHDNLYIFYTLLFFLYYLLIIGAIYILYFNKPDWKMYYKIILIFLFSLFPFVIHRLEKFMYNSWIYLYSMLSGNVYNNMSYSNKVVLNNTTNLTTNE